MRVLIPGGAGYIGSILTGHLLDLGYKVTVLDNLRYHQRSLFGYASNPNFEFEFGDTRDRATLEPLMAKNDVVIHLAAVVGMPACQRDSDYAYSLNYGAAKLVAELAGKDQRIVFPSTNSGYGATGGEQQCDETTPIAPVSLYGTSKLEGEKAILDSGKGMSLRLATVFGASPRMRTDLLVNDFTYKAYSQGSLVVYEGHFMRNFVGVQDAARATVFAVNNFEAMRGEVYNLGLDSANMSKLDLCRKVQEHVPGFYFTEAPVGSDPDKRNYIASSEKLRKAGFEATQTLDQGIRELLSLYKMFGRSEFGNV